MIARCLVIALIFLTLKSWSVEMDDTYALIVSAEDSYLKGEVKLAFVKNDADRLTEALERFSHIPKQKILRLTNPTRNQFASAFTLLKANAIKKFVFYYSGHSDDSGLHFSDGLVSKGELFDLFSSVHAKTKIIVFDSCFSGGLRAKGVKKVDLVVPVSFALDEPTGSVILTSSSSDEFSYESDKLRGSIFTYHLVSGLYGQADLNNDGLVTIDELYSYTYLQTKHQSLVSGGKIQNPEFQNQLAGQGSLVIGYLEKQLGQLELAPALEGEVLIATDSNSMFFRFNKVKGETSLIKIPKGIYNLTVISESREGLRPIMVADSPVAIDDESLRWGRRVRPSLKVKGSLSQTLFGVLLADHPSFKSEEKSGSSFEVQVQSSVLWDIGLRWRFASHFGSETHSSSYDKSSVTKYSRLTVGLDGAHNALLGPDWEWLMGFRLGVRWTAGATSQTESASLNNLSVGLRWHYSDKFKVDSLLGIDTIKVEGQRDRSVPMLGVGLLF